ncbi:Protein of unknown function [Micromonospora pallida]|uniref:Uncharacterized protein n=1 Tax=Micromonospora pallida TaxID=145854 RepID=A0A1C6RT26_9ACTN|nr:hypothetical protein [Micromonospora pallida]SCL20367.1 Protein of unknown function [Micromonospora pallida]
MTGTYTGRTRATGRPWQPPGLLGTPPARLSHQPAIGQLDAELTHAVRRAAQMRAIFYVVVLLVALTGQVTGATQKLDIPLLIAIPAVGALELGGVVVMANADVRRRLGESALASRMLSAAIAAGATAFNWLAHDNHLLGGFFAGMSALGYLVWLTHVENVRRDRLRAIGALPATTPSYEPLGHWLRHPLITRRARSMAKADPGLGLYGSLDAARTALRREHRNAAIAKILRRKIRTAVDPTTATIAVHVYDLDQIAARLADTADYDGLTTLIAADLTPARIASGPERRPRRIVSWCSSRLGRPGTVTEPLPKDDSPVGGLVEPERLAPATEGRRHRQVAGGPGSDLPEPPAATATEHVVDDAAPKPPQRDLAPDGAKRTVDGASPVGPEEPKAFRGDTDHDWDETSTPAKAEERSEGPTDTVAAVAYWLNVDPRMRLDEIARRIGRSERTVRRNLPPGFRRSSVRDRP